MAREHPPEVLEKSEDLYVFEGFTQQRVAQAMGIPLSRVKSMASGNDWVQKRKEHLNNLKEIKRKKFVLLKEVMDNALDTLDPKAVNAACRLLAAADVPGSGRNGPGDAHVPDRPALFLEDLRFIAETLKEVDPKGLKVFAANFDAIIARFKEKHAKTP